MAPRACKRCKSGACESSVRSEGARGRRWHLRSKQQATTLGTGQFVSGQHHMVVPVESRLKGCQHRAPKVRKSGSRGCRQAKCVSKLQRQQPHICLEVKQPTSWLELPPSLGGAGGLDAAPAAERLLLQARETLCSGRTGARRRSTAAETLSNVGAASSSRRPGRHCKKQRKRKRHDVRAKYVLPGSGGRGRRSNNWSQTPACDFEAKY